MQTGSSEPLEKMWTTKVRKEACTNFTLSIFFFLKVSWREKVFLPLKFHHRSYLFSFYNQQTSSQRPLFPFKLLSNLWNEVTNDCHGSFWHFCLQLTTLANPMCLIRPFMKTRFIDHQPLHVVGTWQILDSIGDSWMNMWINNFYYNLFWLWWIWKLATIVFYDYWYAKL